jgi:hypothetical protein
MALITDVCCRMSKWRVRWSVRQLCCSGVTHHNQSILAKLAMYFVSVAVCGIAYLIVDAT